MNEDKKPKVADRRVIFESKRFRVVEKDVEFKDTQTTYAVLLLEKHLRNS